MGQINTNNYPTVDSLADADLLIVENATHGTGTTTPKQLRENAIGTDPLQTTAQTVTGAVNELKSAIDAGSDVKNYDIDTISSGYLGEFDGKAKILLLHLTTDGTADATDGYTMLLSYTRPVARLLYGQLVDSEGVAYKQNVYAENTIICAVTNSGEGTESDPRQVVILGITNAGFMLTPTAVVSDRDIIDGQGNTLSVLAEALTKTASGNPIVITDCAGGKARSLKTTIEPIQDLHGYDHPWSGGAGKNLLPINCANSVSHASVSYTVQKDADNNKNGIKINGTASSLSYCIIAGDGASNNDINSYSTTVYASGESLKCGSLPTNVSLHFRYTDGTYAQNVQNTSITLSKNVGLVFLQVENGTNINNQIAYPIICASTETDMSFAPYANICPISGYDSVSVERTGANLWDESYAGIATSIKYTAINVGNGSFTLDTTAPRYDESGCAVFLLAGNVSSGANNTDHGAYNGNPRTQTAVNGYVTVAYRTIGDIDPRNYVTHLLKDSDKQTASATLPTTVYGGSVDLKRGKAVVTHAITTYSASEVDLYTDSFSNLRYARVPKRADCVDYNKYTSNGISSKFIVSNIGSGDFNNVQNINKMIGNTEPNKYWIGCAKNITLQEAQDLIGGTQHCYPLATPIELDLTPTTLELLKGYNTVTSNGTTIYLTYSNNPNETITLKVNKSDIAPTEGNTASRAYAVNEFMFRGDALYKVTQAIASGASITDSNTSRTTIGAVLTALLNGGE